MLTFAGWNSPRKSAELVYPDGLNKGASDDEMNISFSPSPNYTALAEGATDSHGKSDGWMKGVQAKTVAELTEALEAGIKRVHGQGKGMLIEALI